MPRALPKFLVVLVAVLAGCGGPAPPADPRPNVLLVLVDALRKDHLGLYGYERPTSPAIDRLGEEGWVFENHICHATNTVPSLLSLMLSQYPVEHGFVHRELLQYGTRPPLYPQEFLFLAEVFQEAGYATSGFVANPFFCPRNGFQQGFDQLQSLQHFKHWFRDGGGMTEAARIWLRGHAENDKRPFFMYVHYMDVHSPYAPPPAYVDRYPRPPGSKLVFTYGKIDGVKPDDLAHTIALYDAEINYVDDMVARLIKELSSLGLRDNTIIAFTSDHGDEFLEHGGMGHATTVYGELVRIPLVMRYPPKLAAGKRVEHLSQHVGLAPALLELAEVDKPPSFRGHSVMEPADFAFAEDRWWRAVYADGKKLILNQQTGETFLFDAADEHDQHALEDDEATKRMMSYLEPYLALEKEATQPTQQEAEAWTEDQLEILKTLGYAQ